MNEAYFFMILYDVVNMYHNIKSSQKYLPVAVVINDDKDLRENHVWCLSLVPGKGRND